MEAEGIHVELDEIGVEAEDTEVEPEDTDVEREMVNRARRGFSGICLLAVSSSSKIYVLSGIL